MKFPTPFQHVGAEVIRYETQCLPRPCRKREVGKTNKSNSDWQSRFETLEQLVVDGKHDECRTRLHTEISIKEIPRDWLNPFVDLAFRVQLPVFVLKALHPYVYPENTFAKPASDKEKSNYASALYTFGATEESVSILKTVDFDVEPTALFHMAGALFANWNYADALPYLQRYVNAESITDYKRLVGQLNIIPALVFNETWPEAEAALLKVTAICQEKNYRLLLGNCFELQAQIDFFQNRYDQALASIEKSIQILREQGGFYILYAEKWQAICKCFKSRDESSLAELREVKRKALAVRHWNTIRECDLFEAILTRNQDLIRRVIMGTPSEFYRARARKMFGTSVAAKGSYQLQLGETTPTSKSVLNFDPLTGTSTHEALFKKPRLYGLFLALTEDFYQPASVGFLFKRTYADEKYNPDSSPQRVLQLLKRLNHWFEENQLPLEVRFKKSEFSLIAKSPVQIKISRNTSLSAGEAKMNEFRSAMKDRMFSTQDVCEALTISTMSANRLIRSALQSGILQKEKGRGGRPYLFTNKRKVVAA